MNKTRITANVNNSTIEKLTIEERSAIGFGSSVGDDNIYFQISVPWLNLTTDDFFTNSWVYVDACESAKVDEGPTSFSEAFLNLGAGGYNGFDVSILYPVANLITATMMEKFSSGLSFSIASKSYFSLTYILLLHISQVCSFLALVLLLDI